MNVKSEQSHNVAYPHRKPYLTLPVLQLDEAASAQLLDDVGLEHGPLGTSRFPFQSTVNPNLPVNKALLPLASSYRQINQEK